MTRQDKQVWTSCIEGQGAVGGMAKERPSSDELVGSGHTISGGGHWPRREAGRAVQS